ncbi:MAG: hypothetical protein WBF71_13720 [Microthrixaceae bacterium]
MAAAAGPDLVIVIYPNETAGRPSTAVRTSDGLISSLPSLPFAGGVGISSVGDSVAVGGIECLDKGCRKSAAAFALLAQDRKSWQRLDAPEARFTGEVEVSALSVGRHEHGLFLIGPDVYAVAPSGEVTTVPRSPVYGSEYGLSCVAGDTMVAVEASGVSGSEVAGMISELELYGDVHVLRLGSIQDGWQLSGPVPEGVRTSYSNLCLAERFSFQSGEQEASFGVTDGTWTQNSSNLLALVGSPIFSFGAESTAFSADGATNYLVHEGRVLAQSEPGVWVDTTEKASRIWGTSAAVVGYDDSTGSFKKIGST